LDRIGQATMSGPVRSPVEAGAARYRPVIFAIHLGLHRGIIRIMFDGPSSFTIKESACEHAFFIMASLHFIPRDQKIANRVPRARADHASLVRACETPLSPVDVGAPWSA
jgi:hypothetical protein